MNSLCPSKPAASHGSPRHRRPCTLANLENRRFGDTWPIECAGVTLTLDQEVANFNNADLTGGHFEGFKLETDFNGTKKNLLTVYPVK